MALLVKNPPAMQDTWVGFLGQEDPLEKEMANHFSILASEIQWTEKPGVKICGVPKSQTKLSNYNTTNNL